MPSPPPVAVYNEPWGTSAGVALAVGVGVLAADAVQLGVQLKRRGLRRHRRLVNIERSQATGSLRVSVKVGVTSPSRTHGCSQPKEDRVEATFTSGQLVETKGETT